MSKIRIKLKPQNGVKVKTDTTYLFDPTLALAMIALSREWAIKQDGQVEEEGEEVDYSSKAWAIGGTGTETNNSKYYASQASTSATNASNSEASASASAVSAGNSAGIASTKASEASASATSASGSASTATTQAGIATTQAGIATTKAGIATTKAGEASTSATNAHTSEVNAAGSEERAQIWAEGDDEDVVPLGGTHSSLVSAGLAYAYANAPEDTPVEEFAATHNIIVQGQQGPQGPMGPQGPQGPKGEPGGGSYDIDGGRADTIYLVGQIIDGGRADSIYTSAQVINGGNA